MFALTRRPWLVLTLCDLLASILPSASASLTSLIVKLDEFGRFDPFSRFSRFVLIRRLQAGGKLRCSQLLNDMNSIVLTKPYCRLFHILDTI